MKRNKLILNVGVVFLLLLTTTVAATNQANECQALENREFSTIELPLMSMFLGQNSHEYWDLNCDDVIDVFDLVLLQKNIDPELEYGPVLGDENAEVSVIEFADFQGPFSRLAHEGVLREFNESDHFKQGRFNLIYKHYPLTTIHENARLAAEAAECANQQGRFWEYHDRLFANQNELEKDDLKKYATWMALDIDEFNICLDNGDAKAKVDKDLDDVQGLDVRGTPTFFVVNNKNGEIDKISGDVPYRVMEDVIEKILS